MNSIAGNRRNQVLTIAIAAILVTSVAAVSLSTPPPLEGIRVGVYVDRGVTAASYIALQHMFEWMGAAVIIINGSEVAGGILDTLDLVAMPGGCWCDERCEILDDMEVVRQFVMNGGAYFGVDGGASYATGYRLALFNGTLFPDVNGTGNFLIDVNVNLASTGPDLSTESSSYTLFYEDSGYFLAENMTGIIPIATYSFSTAPCMIVFEYGSGRVFLSSPHPEYEEGSLRDGTDYFDTSLSDPDSEWNFMLKICQWLLT